MEPAIHTGEWLWIDKLTYGGRLPERWADILCLWAGAGTIDYRENS